MENQVGQLRQGDVLLVPVDMVPPVDAHAYPEVILAEGEFTGHAHRLQAATVLEWSVNGQRYVRVSSSTPGSLTHEDHDPIPVAVVQPQVTYRVVPQREWNLAGEWQRVLD